MPDGGEGTPDYHVKPVLAARVDPDIKAWVYEEAPRRGRTIGEFLTDVLAAERDRAAAQVPMPGFTEGN